MLGTVLRRGCFRSQPELRGERQPEQVVPALPSALGSVGDMSDQAFADMPDRGIVQFGTFPGSLNERPRQRDITRVAVQYFGDDADYSRVESACEDEWFELLVRDPCIGPVRDFVRARAISMGSL